MSESRVNLSIEKRISYDHKTNSMMLISGDIAVSYLRRHELIELVKFLNTIPPLFPPHSKLHEIIGDHLVYCDDYIRKLEEISSALEIIGMRDLSNDLGMIANVWRRFNSELNQKIERLEEIKCVKEK